MISKWKITNILNNINIQSWIYFEDEKLVLTSLNNISNSLLEKSSLKI
jgi:hypothetical protein